jgi:alpha-N-arabinofuranosidase
MANVAQTIDCLHSLCAAVGDKYMRTPAYYIFELYRPHMGARIVPMTMTRPDMNVPVLEGTGRLPRMSGSASLHDKRLTVTLTNPSLDDRVATRLRGAGGDALAAMASASRVRDARATILTHEDMHAANTFERPDTVGLKSLPVDLSREAASLTIPIQAIVAVTLDLV